MSDEAVAGSNPAANEVVQPVASEPVAAAPEAAPAQAAQPEPAKSAREALERSFAKLEVAPGEQSVEAKPDRLRTPDGKFAPKEAKPAEAKIGEVRTDVQVAASTMAAPTRFSKEAQAEWAKAPPLVQQETLRAVNELTQGIEKYREAAEAFEPVRKFHDLAKQHGVSMADAMQNYVHIDHLWGTNPVNAFFETCRKTRVDPSQLINAIVNGNQLQQQGPDPRDQQIQALLQEVNTLKQEVGGVKQTFQQTQKQSQEQATLNEVQKFASDKPYFNELIPDITKMIETGFASDLSDAYEKASRLNPVIAEKIATDKAPKQPASNAKAALSIAGTPTGASNAQTKPAGSTREALERAFARVGA